jgi:hypothetical protein
MTIRIHVTKEILERSKMCGELQETERVSKHCAISLAVIDLFPNAITTNWIYIDEHDSLGISMPRHAHEFIVSFDSKTPGERVKMEEISFEIDVPDSVIEKIGITEAQEIIKNSKTLELV